MTVALTGKIPRNFVAIFFLCVLCPTLWIARAKAGEDKLSGLRARRRSVVPLLGVLALACTVSACSSGPHISAQERSAVAGILKSPSEPTTDPSRGSTTVPAAAQSTTTTSGGASSESTSVTTAPEAASPTGPPPDVVGQDLMTAENQLHAAGYSTTVHPWAASCGTLNLIMQQVPPQSDSVVLYYCTHAS